MEYYNVLIADSTYRGDKALTYCYDGEELLTSGIIVSVPLRSKKALGVVVGRTRKPVNILPKSIYAIHTKTPLPDWCMAFAEWMSLYYPSTVSQALALIVPRSVGHKKLLSENKSINAPLSPLPLSIEPTLTKEQAVAWRTIQNKQKKPILLHGVTGSGKTRLYVEQINKSLRLHQSVIVLTPEIGLTSQLEKTLRKYFGERVLVIHSNMKTKERREQWIRCLESSTPLVVVGPRSALFSPLKSIGTIIVDEAHDNSYRQDQAPHYNAVRAAAGLRTILASTLLLGTATPKVVDYYTFLQKNLPIVHLRETAIKQRHSLEWKIVSNSDRSHFNRSTWISDDVIHAVENAIHSKEQSILYLNRRGTARYTTCDDCTWKATCPTCDLPLVYHADTHKLHCHHCLSKHPAVNVCPECKGSNISLRSVGSKMIESEIYRLFPQANIARFDSDSSGSLNTRYEELQSGSIDIIIGTQMISKGLDLPLLSTVAMIQGDNALNIPDFSAEEELYQQINQLKGRIGRGHRRGLFILQAQQSDHHVINAAINADYTMFYEHTLSERKNHIFPPFVHLLKITASRKKAKTAINALEALRTKINKDTTTNIQTLGPIPASRERYNGKYHWIMILKSRRRKHLIQLCSELKPNLQHDIDPHRLF